MHAHTGPHLACVAAAAATGRDAGGGTDAGLSPHALQQRVVLGAMARRVKSALLHVAHRQGGGSACPQLLCVCICTEAKTALLGACIHVFMGMMQV
eukprot:scaffold94543_cov19-Tisochrysis_lutea.AAC.3